MEIVHPCAASASNVFFILFLNQEYYVLCETMASWGGFIFLY